MYMRRNSPIILYPLSLSLSLSLPLFFAVCFCSLKSRFFSLSAQTITNQSRYQSVKKKKNIHFLHAIAAVCRRRVGVIKERKGKIIRSFWREPWRRDRQGALMRASVKKLGPRPIKTDDSAGDYARVPA